MEFVFLEGEVPGAGGPTRSMSVPNIGRKSGPTPTENSKKVKIDC